MDPTSFDGNETEVVGVSEFAARTFSFNLADFHSASRPLLYSCP